MSFFRSLLLPIVFTLVLIFNSGQGHAACGDGALQTADTLYAAQGVLDYSSLHVLDPNTGSVVHTIGPIGFPITGLTAHQLRASCSVPRVGA